MSFGHFAPARVRAVRPVARDVRLVEIEPATGAQPYPTGSHLDIAVVIDELPDVRSYSLVGDAPVDGAYRIAVKLLPESRGGSAFLHALEEGTELSVSAPQSHFELQHGRPEYLLVAGGIGITPLVGMATVLARQGRAVELLYAGRERAGMPFLDELGELLGERLRVFASAEGERLDVHAAFAELHPEGEVYVCGPVRLLEAARTAWREQGRPATRFRFETFASGGRFAPEPFTVRLADHGGREVDVPRNRTLLAALRSAGVDMMWDCLRGECGLCAARVVEVAGDIDHRDVFLSEEEQAGDERILTCVSRAVGGPITIDTGFR